MLPHQFKTKKSFSQSTQQSNKNYNNQKISKLILYVSDYHYVCIRTSGSKKLKNQPKPVKNAVFSTTI